MRRTAGQPLVRVAMKCSSSSLSRMATWSSPLARAASVPGIRGRCRWRAWRSRSGGGSETMSWPPRLRCASKYCMIGGMVSAGLPPVSRDRLGAWDVGDGKRQPAIDPEGAEVAVGARAHAEPAVVVDVGRAERHARELAEQVGLLVGQPAAAEHAHGVAAVGGLDGADAGHDAAQRLLPARGAQRRIAVVADQGRGEAVGRGQQGGGGPAPSCTARPCWSGSPAPPPSRPRPPDAGSCRIAGRSRGSGCRRRRSCSDCGHSHKRRALDAF